MSMVSYAAGSRYLSLLGGTCMSFYDWYCDLPPASPQTWGEQTDVPESADWYNAGFLMLWGSNVPQTRTPDAHFYTEARYRGTKSAVVSPDYSEAAKFGDIWLAPKQGTDSALAMAMGHVILREFHLDRQAEYFEDYGRKYSDMPMLVRLDEKDGRLVPGRFLRADDIDGKLGETNNPEWKTLAVDRRSGNVVAPNGSVGFRWGQQGHWNLEEKAAGAETELQLSLILDEDHDEIVERGLPLFRRRSHEPLRALRASGRADRVTSRHAGCNWRTARRWSRPSSTCSARTTALIAVSAATGWRDSYEEDLPFTPKWAEKITGVAADKITTVAREFARNAEKTNGKSMVILGCRYQPLVPYGHDLSRPSSTCW